MIERITRFIDGEPVSREVVLRRRTPMEEREYWYLKLGQLMNELRDKDRVILALAERIFLQHELLMANSLRRHLDQEDDETPAEPESHAHEDRPNERAE
jgi:hypothetical protein